MGKSALKSIDAMLKSLGRSGAPVGCLVPENGDISKTCMPIPAANVGYLVPGAISGVHKAYLDGNLTRRLPQIETGEQIIWDTDLVGFGLRVRATGRHVWIVRLRHRGKQRRVTLGRTEMLDAPTARAQARRLLAEVALDGLPKRPTKKLAPTFAAYVSEFWQDYAHHWKPSTQVRNLTAIRLDILPHFGRLRLDTIARSDIIRWRDSCAEGKEARFNRALPVLAAMLQYAERLGYIRKGANPCSGASRFKRKAMERFLSPQEYRRLGRCLAEAEGQFPAQVAIVSLLLFTGARKQEIVALRWDWVQPTCLALPDSKTGPKTIWLCRQAIDILKSIERNDGQPFVFPNAGRDGPLRIETWWLGFRRHCALPDLRLHDLRHSYASIGILHKVALATVGKLLGHELPETTARYAHLADDTIADAAARVSGGLARAIGLSQ